MIERPALYLMIVSQSLFFGIAIIYFNAAWLFSRASVIQPLQSLKNILVALFTIIGGYFAVTGLYWLIWDFGDIDVQPIAFRIFLSAIVFVISIRFVGYIKKHVNND